MKEFWNVVQFVFSAVGGWLGYFLGGCDGLLYALIAFVAIDYVTGVMCAVSDRALSSDFLLHFKRRCEPSGKCRPSGASSATEDQSSIGAVT